MPIEDWLRALLVCPESKKPLVYFEEDGFLLCPASRLKYRIDDGIFVLLVEEAQRLDEAAVSRLLSEAASRGLPGIEAYR